MPREDDPRLWLRFACEDLTVAKGLEQFGAIAMRHRWWHAQQAAEKALKAVLLHRRIPFPRTHDVRALASMLPPPLTVPVSKAALSLLTAAAIEGRYPSDAPDPDPQMIADAVGHAIRLVSWAEHELAVSGLSRSEDQGAQPCQPEG